MLVERPMMLEKVSHFDPVDEPREKPQRLTWAVAAFDLFPIDARVADARRLMFRFSIKSRPKIQCFGRSHSNNLKR